jgi:hypothetical protein
MLLDLPTNVRQGLPRKNTGLFSHFVSDKENDLTALPSSQHFLLIETYSWVQYAGVLHHTWKERFGRDKHYSQGILKGEVSLFDWFGSLFCK